MSNLQETQTSQGTKAAVDVSNARIQFGTDCSTTSGTETFDFATPFGNSNVGIIVNRTMADATSILPVTWNDATSYQINRGSGVNGDQYFNMLTFGSKSSNNVQSSDIVVNGETVAKIQWGTAESTTDSNQMFSFPEAFEGGCYAVFTNRKESNGQSNLAVISVDTNSFTVNRPTSTNGNEEFYWIAIGNCAVSESNNFSFPLGNGYVMKGGRAASNLDAEQVFLYTDLGLENFENSCATVVTTRMDSGSKDILPVTGKNQSSFSINRNDSIDGVRSFFWVAVGK